MCNCLLQHITAKVGFIVCSPITVDYFRIIYHAVLITDYKKDIIMCSSFYGRVQQSDIS